MFLRKLLHTSKLLYLVAIIMAMTSLQSCFFSLAEFPEDVLCEGVSKALADIRKELISDISYDLKFAIPESLDSCINGECTISLNLKEKKSIQLDYKGDAGKICFFSVNGKQLDFAYQDEHIIIPEKYLKAGNNKINIKFQASEQSLNRNSEYLYTLLVPDRARTLFPCFDQPNLKATYNLTLEIPQQWVAVSNTLIKSEGTLKDGQKQVKFAPTEPLSTYLFSFVAGKFSKESRSDSGRTISAYYRESDPKKLMQLNTIFDQIFAALNWLEDYTGIPYPFAKYDFIILPGFQFGGMEHTGATLYNDRMMFFGECPTADEQLMRSQIIAHETAHMWFGDYVTMDWFDDVWTKEVFANYFAAVITEPMYPDIDHTLYRLRTFTALSMTEDRTEGSTPIYQKLDNLQDAGLIYSNIVYNKAPVMMFKLADIMGKEAFRDGIREYLNKYAFGNATWNDLVDILDSKTEKDISSFSEVWVKASGMPTISLKENSTGFTITQTDPYDRGYLWPQSFSVKALHGNETEEVKIDMKDDSQSYMLLFRPDALLPNADGRGYGYFIPDTQSLNYILSHWADISEDITRQSLVMTLQECYYHGKISASRILQSFINGVKHEKNELIASTVLKYIGYICSYTSGTLREQTEQQLAELSTTLSSPAMQLTADRQLIGIASEQHVVSNLYNHWLNHDKATWSEDDYTKLAYELAIRMPKEADKILARQREQITNSDRLEQFDFISRACTADTIVLDQLFNSLTDVKNRRIEPYAERMLYYLNHPCRDKYSVKYIRPGLELLQEIQRTGDIFFPTQWLRSLVESHRCKEARNEVDRFLHDNPDYPQLLKNKILQANYQPGE